MISKLNIAAVSDIHLAHARNNTTDIIAMLEEIFPSNPDTASLDLIILVGDIFDRLVSMNEGVGFIIKDWMSRFLRRCKSFNIPVLVLEGTPSHDWKQSRWFVSQNDNGNIGCELYYADELSIVTIQSLGVDILCVPDEWRHETDDTWKEVVELMARMGKDKVHLAAMHGMFTFQLPPHVKEPVHVPERYLGVVKHLIFIGHDHKHRVEGRIIIQGSTDRLCHGDEGPKGHVRATVDLVTNEYSIRFIENTKAKIYKTVDCRNLTRDEALVLIMNTTVDLPNDSFIRIRFSKIADLDMQSLTQVVRKNYPQFNWSLLAEKENLNKQDIQDNLNVVYQSTALTRDNIPQLVMDRITAKNNNPDILDKCRQRLEEYFNDSI